MNEIKPVSRLEQIPFYIIEKAIKSYRQLAQRNIRLVNKQITIDQWLILKTIEDNPDITQREIAQYVFKDHASITRMIDLLVKKGYLERSVYAEDRRRFGLELTSEGKMTKEALMPIILQNRAAALKGLTENEMISLRNILQKIIDNCTKN